MNDVDEVVGRQLTVLQGICVSVSDCDSVCVCEGGRGGDCDSGCE